MFHQSLATKFNSGQPSCPYSIILYVWHHNGIIQKPHDHLFQKSGSETMPVLNENTLKTVKTVKMGASPKPRNQIRFWAA